MACGRVARSWRTLRSVTVRRALRRSQVLVESLPAWQEALAECGIPLSVWRLHRRIGMSGGLFLDALQRETGQRLDRETLGRGVVSLH